MTQYEEDLEECKGFASQIDPGTGMAKGAAAGAATGAAGAGAGGCIDIYGLEISDLRRSFSALIACNSFYI